MNYKNLSQVILAMAFTMSLVLSCTEENCEGFPEKDLINVPYQTGDTLYFGNRLDTIYFIIQSFYTTKPYTITTVFPATNNDGCEYYGYAKTDKEKTYDYQIEDEYHGNHRITFTIGRQRDVFEESNSNTQKLNYVTINDYLYENVLYIERDTNSTNSIITRVLKASNHGIIQFTDHSRSITWDKINY